MDDSQEQLNECFAEMEKLKMMEHLVTMPETSNETNMQTSLKVLEKWLKNYREAIEMNKRTKQQYKGLGPIPETSGYEKYSCDKISVRRSFTTGKPIGYYNEPSEFMESYIDATYNMFNIISNRLDDIEKRLEKMK